MSLFVTIDNKRTHLLNHRIVMACPHCRANANLTPLAVPRFEALSRVKPHHVGIGYSCDCCNEPVFLRFRATEYSANEVELDAHYEEVQKAPEVLSLQHFADHVEILFNEALTCYSHGCLNAFATMCRRTAQAVFDDLGQGGKLNVFDQFNEAREIAGVDDESFATIKKVIFDSENGSKSNLPRMSLEVAGVLLELMKDMLYQTYVRKGNLQAALRARVASVPLEVVEEPARPQMKVVESEG